MIFYYCFMVTMLLFCFSSEI